MSALEDRYRRLLRCYPAEHRRLHEDEMLGVLLAAAEPERSRPSLGDALNLVRGGLGIRIRRAPRTLANAGWGDAAALLSVLAPLILLLAAIRYAVAVETLPQLRYSLSHGGGGGPVFHPATSWLLWAAAAVAALAGARRVVVGGVLAAIVVELATFTAYTDYADGTAVTPILLGLITLAALRFGPGAVRGYELLGRRGLAAITVLILLAAALGSATMRAVLSMPWIGMPLILAATAAATAAWLARTPAGRRAAIVLAAPLYPVLAPLYPVLSEEPLARSLVTVVAVPAVLCFSGLTAIALLERRPRRLGGNGCPAREGVRRPGS
jgi:hypothetical protein